MAHVLPSRAQLPQDEGLAPQMDELPKARQANQDAKSLLRGDLIASPLWLKGNPEHVTLDQGS